MSLALIEAASLALALATGAGPERPLIVFRGNFAIIDEVYLAALDLPRDFVPDRAGAQRVRERLLDFLHRGGYEIARVEATARGGRLLVDIDEGRLERVTLSGQGSVRTVQMLLALDLPQEVFNRPFLERQLAALRARFGVEVEKIDLVRLTPVNHPGPQVEGLGSWFEDLGRYLGHPLVSPRADYELHIRFKRREWPGGLSLRAELSDADGLDVGVDQRGGGALFEGDRWIASAELGGKLRSRFADGSTYPALQRAGAELGWFTPPLAAGLRPGLTLQGDLVSRQRPDVGLESYMFTSGRAELAMRFDAAWASARLGGGWERRNVFGLEHAPGTIAPPGVGPSSTTVPYVAGGLQLVFDPDEIRRDRHHRLDLAGRYIFADGTEAFGKASYEYRKVFGIGWHDLGFRSRGAYLFGAPPFYEEQPIGGDYLRGVFDTRFYARRAVSANVEARYSLSRDILKVGLFADVALFGIIDRATNRESPRVAAALGPSFHVLVANAFQLDLCYSWGISARTSLDRGFSANLSQAF